MFVLKEVFIHIAAKDHFPEISQQAIGRFAVQSGIIDQKSIN